MLAELVAVGDVVLELPECAVVLLPGHGVGRILPAAEIHHRLVCTGIGSADVETEFRTVNHVLYRSEFSVDVTGEFLTLEEVGVVHSHSYRVRA